jgi:hypothetical protein
LRWVQGVHSVILVLLLRGSLHLLIFAGACTLSAMDYAPLRDLKRADDLAIFAVQ